MRCSSERTITSGLVLKLCTLAMTRLRCSRVAVRALTVVAHKHLFLEREEEEEEEDGNGD